jgi:hypothetical protein
MGINAKQDIEFGKGNMNIGDFLKMPKIGIEALFWGTGRIYSRGTGTQQI